MGGRESDYRERQMGINSKQQSYGNQLGWHALKVVTGQLLSTKPVAIGPYDNEDPWPTWFDREVLSRRDGFWLSDGMDRAPLDTQVNLLEVKGDTTITSNKEKMLNLVRFGKAGLDDIVIEGNWTSADDVGVMITSAFVAPENVKEVVTKLAKADGFRAWLPLADDYNEFDQTSSEKKRKTFPWIVVPSKEAALDEKDPLGSGVAICRPRFLNEIISLCGLKPTDVFNRSWADSNGRVVCRAEAWGSSEANYEGESDTGKRMTCSRDFLKILLSKKRLDLLLLIVLRKYKKGYGGEDGKFWHSTAVVHITKSLKQEFYPGLASEEHKNNR
jgi:hypothetical protein